MKILKSLSLLLLVALLTSCTIGPTKEEIADMAKWRKGKHDGTEVVTKFLIEKIWNIPLSELFKNAPKANSSHGFAIIHAEKNISFNTSYDNKYNKSCNPSLPELPLVAKISYENYSKNATHKYLKIELGVQVFKDSTVYGTDKITKKSTQTELSCLKDKERLVKEGNSFTSFNWMLSSRYYSEESDKYLASLRARGMIIPGELCRISKIYDTADTKCLIGGIYSGGLVRAGLQIKTTSGYVLDTFQLQGLLVENNQWDLSLSQIVEKRLQDKDYLNRMLSLAARAQGEIYSKHTEIRERNARIDASEAAYKRRLKVSSNKRNKTFGQNLLSSFYKPLPGGSEALSVPNKRPSPAYNPAPSPRPQARVNKVRSKELNNIHKKITKAAVKRSFNAPNTTSKSSGKKPANNISKQNSKNKEVVDYIPIFVQKESVFSWRTKEEACTYGKAKAREVAQKQCKSKNGIQSKQRKNDANCQSYRKMEKDGFSSTKGQWKATGNIIFYCNTSK